MRAGDRIAITDRDSIVAYVIPAVAASELEGLVRLIREDRAAFARKHREKGPSEESHNSVKEALDRDWPSYFVLNAVAEPAQPLILYSRNWVPRYLSMRKSRSPWMKMPSTKKSSGRDPRRTPSASKTSSL